MTTSSSDSPPVAAMAEQDVRAAFPAALPAVRGLQHCALAVYGRLEPERALNWTLEELGELAQAVRRHEGRDRVHEELGQLTAWMLCLANILGADLADAIESAISEEIDRQLAKYGKLTPYQPGRQPDD
ncbi:MAG TPA: MazG nucleotide pyrophosphohydrolase domain-containing protein [Streptosporangiaceae bacterium]|nr:MazG nucleotide pyrophosphohydrolase domain-containing protein [Streptosporangiaceae bacterium]